MFRRAVIRALSVMLAGTAATVVAQTPAADSVPQIGQVSNNGRVPPGMMQVSSPMFAWGGYERRPASGYGAYARLVLG